MIKRVVLLAVVAACSVAFLSEPAAAHWRRGGWGGFGPYPYGWGWYDWPTYYRGGPYGPGWYSPYATYYVPPPPRPDPAYARLYGKCPGARIPARWVEKRDKQGQVILVHQMGRCR